MSKQIKLYVEGKSDQIFFEGQRFRQFASSLGYSLKTKNLRTRGNIITNFEKFLKLQGKEYFATVLVYDQDNQYFDTKRLEEVTKMYYNTFHCVAIQELEAWYIADHEQIRNINNCINLLKDTQTITDPKNYLKRLFFNAGKGYKNETGFADYFADKIDLNEARRNNKSLNKFLKLFENHFDLSRCN